MIDANRHQWLPIYNARLPRGLESQRTALLNHPAAPLPVINTVLTVWQRYCSEGADAQR
jgi:hypothetical protein